MVSPVVPAEVIITVLGFQNSDRLVAGQLTAPWIHTVIMHNFEEDFLSGIAILPWQLKLTGPRCGTDVIAGKTHPLTPEPA